jgi:hypothetical protein
MEQIKKIKQVLKHQHRDELVQIGIRAIEHALRLKPDQATTQVIQQRLSDLRNNDTSAAAEIIREHDETRNRVAHRLASPVPYTKENVLLSATVELFRLATTEKYASGYMLDAIFVKCWDAGIFVGRDDTELHDEMNWQEKELRPLVQQAFESLWTAEDQLREQKRAA